MKDFVVLLSIILALSACFFLADQWDSIPSAEAKEFQRLNFLAKDEISRGEMFLSGCGKKQDFSLAEKCFLNANSILKDSGNKNLEILYEQWSNFEAVDSESRVESNFVNLLFREISKADSSAKAEPNRGLLNCDGFLSKSNSSPSEVYVEGYYRRDGTYVSSHFRSSKDSTITNNWSYLGNINPHTGKVGTRIE